MAQSITPDIDRIKDRINQLGMKKQAVAEKAGITNVHFSRILNGVMPLTDDVREKVFFVLGIPEN